MRDREIHKDPRGQAIIEILCSADEQRRSRKGYKSRDGYFVEPSAPGTVFVEDDLYRIEVIWSDEFVGDSG